MRDLKETIRLLENFSLKVIAEAADAEEMKQEIIDYLKSNQVQAVVSGQQLAEQFHKLYEELAPQFGYETREETKIFNPESNNGKLMITVSEEILKWLSH